MSETESSYRLAIVGWPVANSLSPELWETMGEGRGLEIEYERWPVEPEDKEAWETIWNSDLDAFNVTAPYKEAAAGRCERLSSAAERIASVNTVIRKSGGWRGETTDGYGFLRSLEEADVPVAGQRIALLGTGGAGRAVARAVADCDARVTFVSRAPERAVAGCEDCGCVGWDALDLLESPTIVVNATPLGRQVGDEPPIPYRTWFPSAVAVDLNYDPPVTRFLELAVNEGARAINGVGTLVHQAALAAALVIDGDPRAAAGYANDFRIAAQKERVPRC